MAHLVEEVEVGTTFLRVKFARTVKVSSITNNHFTLATDEATPVPVADAFDPIEISDDYNTISRILTLYYDEDIEADTTYTFTVTGLQDPLGNVIAPESVSFETPATVDTGPGTGGSTGGGGTGGGTGAGSGTGTSTGTDYDYSVEIEDHSLGDADPLFGEDVPVDVPSAAFYVKSTDPLKNEPIVATNYKDGRVTIEFNKYPSTTYINGTYFKAHKKKMQRDYARWEPVSVLVSQDMAKPKVYLDFPSTDTTPVYHTAGKEYFPLDYKFRVRVSKDVDAAQTGSTPGAQGKLDLVIEQGATFRRTITYLQASGEPRDLTGYTARMQIKTAAGGTLLYELTTGNGRIVIDGPNGRISMEILDTDTSGFTWTKGVYDLEIISAEATPTVTRLVEGKVTVTPEVTT
jgi:Big-like domain-containing protein